MKKRGFTLIEIMVVVFIIALLASTVIVVFGYARKKARDTQRIANLVEVASALDRWYVDNQSYPLSGAIVSPPYNQYPYSKFWFIRVNSFLKSNNYLSSCYEDLFDDVDKPYLESPDYCYQPTADPADLPSAAPGWFTEPWGYRYSCWDVPPHNGVAGTGPCQTYGLSVALEIPSSGNINPGNSGNPEFLMCNGKPSSEPHCGVILP